MALASGLRIFADCLIIMSAVSQSSTSIQRMGEDRDILVDIMLRWGGFNSFPRNSVADAFLMSLYLGRLMSSVMGLADKC